MFTASRSRRAQCCKIQRDTEGEILALSKSKLPRFPWVRKLLQSLLGSVDFSNENLRTASDAAPLNNLMGYNMKLRENIT